MFIASDSSRKAMCLCGCCYILVAYVILEVDKVTPSGNLEPETLIQ